MPNYLIGQANLPCSWLPRLPQIVADLGLEFMRKDVLPIRDDLRPLWAENNLLGIEEFARRMGGAMVNESKNMLEEMKKEISEGTGIDVEFFCLLARKLL